MLPGAAIQRLRLASGQVMWVYIACHFLNHALGLISLGAAEAGLTLAVAVWHSWPGTLLLYGAFATHLALALTGLVQRHTLLLPPLELMRIGFGLTIPLLLFGHVVATRIAFSWYGEPAEYQRIVSNLVRDGGTGWQLALLAPGWLHGCMGLNVAFRHRDAYRRARTGLIAAAIALPLLAAAGYSAMTRDAAVLERAAAPASTRIDASQRRSLDELRAHLLAGYVGALAAVLALRVWRVWRLRAARPTNPGD